MLMGARVHKKAAADPLRPIYLGNTVWAAAASSYISCSADTLWMCMARYPISTGSRGFFRCFSRCPHTVDAIRNSSGNFTYI